MLIYGLIFLVLSGWSTYSSVAIPYSIADDFDKNYIQFEERAIYAENIDDAKNGLTSAIDYLESKKLTGGDNFEYYSLLSTQLEKVSNASNYNETDQKIVLLEVKNSLGGDYYREKIPSSIGLPVPVGLYLLWFIASLFMLIFSVGFTAVVIKNNY